MMRKAVVAALAAVAAVGYADAAAPQQAAAALQASNELAGMAAQLKGQAKAPAAAPVDAITKEAEVQQLKALLSQIEEDHGRKTPDAAIEKEAKGVLDTLEGAAAQTGATAAAAQQKAAEESSEESSEASSEESSEASEASEESSESAAPAAAPSLAELHKELADLMVKKASGAASGEELEALNVQIELVLNKIKAATGAKETPKAGEQEQKKERNEIEQITDPLLAHLTNLREHKGQFAGLHDVDVQDMAVNMRRLADLADAYRGGRQADPCAEKDACGTQEPEVKPACPEQGGCQQEKKVVVEAEEKKCGDEPCHAAAPKQMTVVASTKCSNDTKTKCEEPKKATVEPQVVDKCSNKTGACAAQSKSATSTCDACHAEREACHKACQEDKCHDTCHKAQDDCHANKCGTTVARVDVVKPSSSTAETNKCQPTSTGGCQNVKPTTVAKGALTDKKAFLFM